MNYERHKGDKEILSNRHRREWNENLALEKQNLYQLEGKHVQQRGESRLDEISVEPEVSLKTRQTQELHELKHRQDEWRTILRKQHVQEAADFN